VRLYARKVARYRRSRFPRIVKYTFLARMHASDVASEICALTVMVSRSASLTMVGAAWTRLTVCPSGATIAITVPSMGAPPSCSEIHPRPYQPR